MSELTPVARGSLETGFKQPRANHCTMPVKIGMGIFCAQLTKSHLPKILTEYVVK